jgi:hypothetical protein
VVKKVLLVSLLFFPLVVFGAPVLARDSEDSELEVQGKLLELREKRLEVRDERREKRQKLDLRKQGVRDKIATKQAELKKESVERIKQVFSKILARMNAALIRLDKLALRIASRIEKLQARGVDTAKTEAELVEAEAFGAAAANAIGLATEQINAIDASDTSVRDVVLEAKGAVKTAKEALKAYHKALVEAIRELKASDKEATQSAQ